MLDNCSQVEAGNGQVDFRPMSQKSQLDNLRSFRNARNCIQIILGRHPLGPHEVRQYIDVESSELLRFLAQSAEFRVEVELPLLSGGSSNSQRFIGEPSQRLCQWTATEIPLAQTTRTKIAQITGWRDLIFLIWTDATFQNNLEVEQFPTNRIERFLRCLENNDGRKLLKAKHGQTKSVCVIDDFAIVMELPAARKDFQTVNIKSWQKAIYKTINVKRDRNRFQPVTDDPQIYLTGAASGQYKMHAVVKYQRKLSSFNDDYFQLFFDFGNGFSEEHSVKYILTSQELNLVLYLDLSRPVEQIRLDPTSKKIPFIIEKLDIEQITLIDLRAEGMFR